MSQDTDETEVELLHKKTSECSEDNKHSVPQTLDQLSGRNISIKLQ